MNIRLAITITVLLLLIGGGITIEVLRRENAVLRQEKEQLVKAASDSGRIARTYINLYGQAVSKNNVLELTHRNARAIQAQELAFTRLFEGVKKNLKNLETAFRSQSEVLIKLKLKNSDTLIVQPHADAPADTITATHFSYGDNYNIIQGLVLSDTTQLDGYIAVPIDGVNYWQRKHKFIFKNWRIGKKQYFSEMTSPNPWVHITQHEFINIGRKK